jgi:hypothetical protein
MDDIQAQLITGQASPAKILINGRLEKTPRGVPECAVLCGYIISSSPVPAFPSTKTDSFPNIEPIEGAIPWKCTPRYGFEGQFGGRILTCRWSKTLESTEKYIHYKISTSQAALSRHLPCNGGGEDIGIQSERKTP